MSGAKRMLEDIEERERCAREISIEAKAVTVCEMGHGVLLKGSGDVSRACAVGNSKLNKGHYPGVFQTRPQMTDAVKAVIDEVSLSTCPVCDKMLDD